MGWVFDGREGHRWDCGVSHYSATGCRSPARAQPLPVPCATHLTPLSPSHSCCSYGAFWMSLAIFTTLSAAGVFVATPEKGDRLMLTLWGILVRFSGDEWVAAVAGSTRQSLAAGSMSAAGSAGCA